MPPRLSSALRGSAAWMVVPAAAMAVSLGVGLPTPARAAAQTIASGTAQVNLTTAYPGQYLFFVPSGTTVNATTGNGIFGSPGTFTLFNQGTVESSAAIGVSLSAGTVNNGGSYGGNAATSAAYIDGRTNGVSIGGAGSVYNLGTIKASNNNGVYIGGSGTVTNTGTIASASTSGVYIKAGGTVTNSGTISGGNRGVFFNFAPGTLVNTGTILGGTASILEYGVQTYGGSISNAGLIQGYAGVRSDAAITLTNSGTIIGTGSYGLTLLAATIDNSGLIQGAVDLTTGGSIHNSGTIAGANYGIEAFGLVTLTNTGTVSAGSSEAVALTGGGIVTNSGTVTGLAGVAIAGGTGTVINSGVIRGTGTAIIGGAVVFSDNYGTFNNTVINTGTIIAASGKDAIQFAAGNDRLILGAGYSFTGVVDGGGGTNTLELESGTVNGANRYSEFLNFQNLQLDAGASLAPVAGGTISSGITLTNDGSIANTAGYTIAGVFDNAGTFTNSGSLDVTGTLTNSTGGILTNSGTIVGASGPGVAMTGGSTLTNTGVIQGTPYGLVAGAGDIITNSGTIADAGTAGVSLGSGATFTNQAGGLLTGVTGAEFSGTGATLTNYGVIAGTGGTAVQFDAGGNTLTLGTGSTLNGAINGGSGAGTINLIGTGTIANTISNFGAGSMLAIAKGASWTITGPVTIASVANSGTFTPGAPGAPLKVTGNFSQSATGVFRTVLNSDGTANALQVTGTATLDGTVLVAPPTTITQPIKYTILTATGGVSGTFSGVSGGTALLTPSLSYDSNDVFVTLVQEALASIPNATANQSAAGAGLDAAVKADPAAFAATLSALDSLQTPAITTNLDRLSGENEADLSTVALLTGRQFIRQFQNHALAHGPDDHGADIWASGFGQSGNVDGDANSHRLNEGSAGGAIGAETEAIPNLDLGLMLGYGVGHFNVKGGLGEGRIDYTEFALTGDYSAGPLYLTAILGGMEGRGTSLRNVSVPGIAATARGKVSDRQFLGAVETGYRMDESWGVNLTPFLGLNFGAVKEDSFTETGGGPLDLTAASRSTASVQSELGARLFENMSLGGLPLSTDVKLAWGHDFAGTARQADLSFAGGTPFLISGARVPADSAVIGLGLAARIMEGGAVTLHYDGDFAGRAQSNAVSLGFRFNW